MDTQIDGYDDVTIVSLAGFPGSGKTTLCRELCNMGANFRTFKAPSASIAESKLLEPSEFLASQCQKIKEFGTLLKPIQRSNPGCIIVCDRGMEDIICYTHFVLNIKHGLDASVISELLRVFPTIDMSHICIFISTEKSTLEERERLRSKPNFGRGLTNLSEYWSFYEDWFLSRPSVIPVVTDHLDITGSSKLLAGVIRQAAQESKLNAKISQTIKLD